VDVSSGGGEIKIDGVTVESFPHTMEAASSSTVIIEAVPGFGRVFDGWGGDMDSNTNPFALYFNCDKDITASFSIDWRLYGLVIGCLVVVIFLVSVLIIRRKA
jgi:hypothetical protein